MTTPYPLETEIWQVMIKEVIQMMDCKNKEIDAALKRMERLTNGSITKVIVNALVK